MLLWIAKIRTLTFSLSNRSRRYDYIKNRIKKGYISLEQSTEVQPLADCKGRALRKVQEQGSAGSKAELGRSRAKPGRVTDEMPCPSR